ncbi:MAG: WD40 repeat domain-containing protein [Planctomycetales bacterium]
MIQRLGSRRFKVPGGWRQLAFAGDDEWIWIKADNRLWVIHRETGRVVNQRQLRLADRYIPTLTASPDGSRIAIGMTFFSPGDDNIVEYGVVILSARTTAHLREWRWKGPRGEITCLSYSGDGDKLMTGAGRGGFALWNVETGERVRKWQPEKIPSHAALSPDGRKAVVGGWQSEAMLWSLEPVTAPIPLPGRGRNVSAVAFESHGRVCATVQRDAVRLWDTAKGEPLATLVAGEPNGYSEADFGIAFTPDGKLLAIPATSMHRIDLWDIATRQRVGVLPVHSPRGLVISRNGRWLAASTEEEFTTIFDLRTQQPVNSPELGHRNEVSQVHYLDSQTIVTSSMGDARIWDASTGRQEQVLAHLDPRSWVRGLSISPDKQQVVTSGFDDIVGIWDRKTGKRVHSFAGHGCAGRSRTIRFTADGGLIVSWGDDGVLRRFDPRAGSCLSARALGLPGFAADPDQVSWEKLSTSVLSADARTLLVRTGEMLFELDTATGKELRQTPFFPDANPLVLSPDGRWLATAYTRRDDEGNGTGMKIRLMQRGTFQVEREWDVVDPHKTDSANHAKPDSDNPDEPKRPPQPPTVWESHCDQGIAFSPDSTLLAWSRMGPRNGIDIVDLRRQQILASIPVESPAGCLEFSPDGAQLASGHHDSTTSIWNLHHPHFAIPSPKPLAPNTTAHFRCSSSVAARQFG